GHLRCWMPPPPNDLKRPGICAQEDGSSGTRLGRGALCPGQAKHFCRSQQPLLAAWARPAPSTMRSKHRCSTVLAERPMDLAVDQFSRMKRMQTYSISYRELTARF